MNVKIGQIFRRSWGYDQTNVDYFQVVAIKAKTVVVRAISYKEVPGSRGFMSCSIVPDKDNFIGSELPKVCRVSEDASNGSKITVGTQKWAYLVKDGEKAYCSWYA